MKNFSISLPLFVSMHISNRIWFTLYGQQSMSRCGVSPFERLRATPWVPEHFYSLHIKLSHFIWDPLKSGHGDFRFVVITGTLTAVIWRRASTVEIFVSLHRRFYSTRAVNLENRRYHFIRMRPITDIIFQMICVHYALLPYHSYIISEGIIHFK